MKFFQMVKDTNDLEACARVLEPKDVRAEFDLAFRRFSQSIDMLLPDQRALAYHADLRWLGKIRGTARARYRDDRLDLIFFCLVPVFNSLRTANHDNTAL